MAYAIIGGLFVATLLTLLFLPALYVAWFRVKEPQRSPNRASERGYPRSPNSAWMERHAVRARLD